MGIEPFIIPRREPAPDKMPESASREDRVAALAKLLHSRGLTSSMADARRLAEGMVEVEKKVVKAASKPAEPVRETHTKADLPDAAASRKPIAHGLNLPESFAHFVAHAQSVSHESTSANSVPLPSQHAPAAVSYGREESRPIPHVPHVAARKQVFFEDAPPITAARGYKGPAPKPVEFHAQREDVVRRLERAAPAAAPVDIGMPPAKAEAPAVVETTFTREGDAVAATRIERSEDIEIVQEQVIIVDEPAPEPAQPPASAAQPQVRAEMIPDTRQPASERAAEAVSEEPSRAAETPAPAAQQSAPREDLAKKHGVDLFEMFKKK